MSENQKKQLEQQLSNIANTLQGKILLHTNDILKQDQLLYENIDEATEEGTEVLEKEIDLIVNELYGLSEEDIKIVEGIKPWVM